MTATSTPFGLIPVRKLGSNYNSTGSSQYTIADAYNTNIFNGDVVTLVAGGTIEKDAGTTTLSPIGVFIGAEYVGGGELNYLLHGNYYPANTAGGRSGRGIQGYVLDDPDQEFIIQADGSVPANAVGSNAAVVQGSGSTFNGKSGIQLNAASIATTSTLPLRILGLHEIDDNEFGDSFTIVRVKFNNHQLTTQTGV